MYTLDCTNCSKSPPNDSSMSILIAETFTNHCTNQFETCFIDASANDQTSSWWMFYKEEIKQLTSHVYILKKYCQIKRAGNLVLIQMREEYICQKRVWEEDRFLNKNCFERNRRSARDFWQWFLCLQSFPSKSHPPIPPSREELEKPGNILQPLHHSRKDQSFWSK